MLPQDATELVAKLRACHYAAQGSPEEKGHLAHSGLDLVRGVVRDAVADGVLEPALAKLKIVQVGCLCACVCMCVFWVGGAWGCAGAAGR